MKTSLNKRTVLIGGLTAALLNAATAYAQTAPAQPLRSCDVTLSGYSITGKQVNTAVANVGDLNGNGRLEICFGPGTIIDSSSSGGIKIDRDRVGLYGDPGKPAVITGYLPTVSVLNSADNVLANLSLGPESTGNLNFHDAVRFSGTIDGAIENVDVDGGYALGLKVIGSSMRAIKGLSVNDVTGDSIMVIDSTIDELRDVYASSALRFRNTKLTEALDLGFGEAIEFTNGSKVGTLSNLYGSVGKPLLLNLAGSSTIETLSLVSFSNVSMNQKSRIGLLEKFDLNPVCGPAIVGTGAPVIDVMRDGKLTKQPWAAVWVYGVTVADEYGIEYR